MSMESAEGARRLLKRELDAVGGLTARGSRGAEGGVRGGRHPRYCPERPESGAGPHERAAAE